MGKSSNGYLPPASAVAAAAECASSKSESASPPCRERVLTVGVGRRRRGSALSTTEIVGKRERGHRVQLAPLEAVRETDSIFCLEAQLNVAIEGQPRYHRSPRIP